jgi:hypothetical protein
MDEDERLAGAAFPIADGSRGEIHLSLLAERLGDRHGAII